MKTKILVIIIGALALNSWAVKKMPPLKFKSAKPQFSKISLTEDDSNVIGIAFDQSRGSGTCYDVAYIFSADAKEPITKYKRLESKVSFIRTNEQIQRDQQNNQQNQKFKEIKFVNSRDFRREITSTSFEEMSVPLKFNKYCERVKDPWHLQLYTIKKESSSKEKNSKKRNMRYDYEFKVKAKLKMVDKKDNWEYTFYKRLNTSPKLSYCNIQKFNDRPQAYLVPEMNNNPKKIKLIMGAQCQGNLLKITHNLGEVFGSIKITDDKNYTIQTPKKRIPAFGSKYYHDRFESRFLCENVKYQIAKADLYEIHNGIFYIEAELEGGLLFGPIKSKYRYQINMAENKDGKRFSGSQGLRLLK